MKVDLVDAIDALWRRDFLDVPWLEQALTVQPGARRPGPLFQFIIEGGGSALEITPGARLEPGGPVLDLDPSLYELERTPDQLGILLRVAPGQAVDGIRIVQSSQDRRLARLVCLENDPAEGQWEVIYNSIDRGKQFLAAADRLADRAGGSLPADLVLFLRHLVGLDFRKAGAAFEKSAHLRRRQSDLQRFTERFELQLNAHGMKRTFKFWHEREKAEYLEGTKELAEALRRVSPHVSLGFGAVLGHERDRDLIGHDDDLDLLLAFEATAVADLGRALDITARALAEAGFEVQGHFFSHLWVRTRNGHRVDVFVGLIEADDTLSFYPSARRSLRPSDVFPAVEATLYGVALPMPARSGNYLCKTYGEAWREPDIGFAHPWDRDAYADIAGVRAVPPIRTRGEMARLAARQA